MCMTLNIIVSANRCMLFHCFFFTSAYYDIVDKEKWRKTCNIMTRVKHCTIEQLLIVDITSQRKGASVTVIDNYVCIYT